MLLLERVHRSAPLRERGHDRPRPVGGFRLRTQAQPRNGCIDEVVRAGQSDDDKGSSALSQENRITPIEVGESPRNACLLLDRRVDFQ